MRALARSDRYRDRVDGWIEKEHQRIGEIKSKIREVKDWISEMEAKLG